MRSLRETYTLRNIRAEIAHRLAAWKRRTPPAPATPPAFPPYDDSHARSVGEFYDAHHDAFMKVYGEVIQAFRTKNASDLLDHQLRSIGFSPGQRVLDAGCGIAAPAAYFAKHASVDVDGITISRVQYDAARRKIAAEGLQDRVTVALGDYHRLAEYFSEGAYDVVYFLESFGHSRTKARAIDAAWKVLKPGGVLYIKDLFARIPLQPAHRAAIDGEIHKINDAYRYEIGSLTQLLDDVRRRGFALSSLTSIDFDLDAFEDLAISNEFQELTGIARIENWDEYIFPVDFFEVKCTKPGWDLKERLDRHFLQQRYHRRPDQRATAGGPAIT